MRYLKGSIVISEALDLPLLLHVRNARYISFSQLLVLMQYENTELARRRLAWRLDRLTNAGYVRTLEQRARGEKIYAVGHKGLTYLEMMGYGLLSLLPKRRGLLDPVRMLHALELTDIRIALGNTGIVQLWKTDVEVSSENIAHGDPYAKDYDAIATLVVRGNLLQYGIEYERSTKAFARYRELRTILSEEQRLSGILYFISGMERFFTVAAELEGAHPDLLFCCADGFGARMLDAPCIRISSEPALTLVHALGRRHERRGSDQ